MAYNATNERQDRLKAELRTRNAADLRPQLRKKNMETVIIEEFRKGIAEIKGGITETQSVLKEVEDENQRLKADLDKVRRQ